LAAAKEAGQATKKAKVSLKAFISSTVSPPPTIAVVNPALNVPEAQRCNLCMQPQVIPPGLRLNAGKVIFGGGIQGLRNLIINS